MTAAATCDDWGVPPELCEACGMPLKEHWRGRRCLRADEPEKLEGLAS